MKLTTNNHGLEIGDTLIISVDNDFWKVFYHWIFQRNLRRQEVYTITALTNTTINIEDK